MMQGNAHTFPSGKLDKDFPQGVAFVTYALLCVNSKHWSKVTAQEAQMDTNLARGNVADTTIATVSSDVDTRWVL